MKIFKNISQCVTLAGVASRQGRHPDQKSLNIIEDAAIVTDTNKILWVGETRSIPSEFKTVPADSSGKGEVWFPALVECHTHLVFGGNRHHDYSMRVGGKTYQEIAAEGGGILSTVNSTRRAKLSELVSSAKKHVDQFEKFGVGAIEIKSGYGLTLESEKKMLECVSELQNKTSVKLISTFLPAHAVPPEFSNRSEDYVESICQDYIPEISAKKLATFFDVFTERGYFSVEQTEKLCRTAVQFGFQIKLHCDQFTDLGGVALGVDLGAKSIDHLDCISDESIKKLANSETVAVLLPGASLFTGTHLPPARKLIDAGARVALSTDFNPGTCPSRNLPLMTTLGCSQLKMTIPEAIAAVTYTAAAAVGLEKEMGSLEIGKDFRVFRMRAESYEVLPYCFGEI